MSKRQRGHFDGAAAIGSARAAAVPQCGQCRVPMNIMPKHEGQDTVANFDSQNAQCEAADEVAAPQLGQLSVLASIYSHSVVA